jgi:hypothetical protein
MDVRLMLRSMRLILPYILLSILGDAVLTFAGIQLSSSVVLFYAQEYEPPGNSTCTSILREAAKHGSKRVNIVPTLYFVDRSSQGTPGGCNPDNWQLNVQLDYYCYYPTYDTPCTPLSLSSISTFQSGFQACLQDAFDLGFSEILISPHLDDGTKTDHWRNMLLFDPLHPDSNGNTYWDIMLHPIVNAATAIVFPTTATASNSSSSSGRGGRSSKEPKSIWLSLQGEMGGTLWTAPRSYQQIMTTIKSTWGAAQQQQQLRTPAADTPDAAAAGPATLLIGVLLSPTNVPGEQEK